MSTPSSVLLRALFREKNAILTLLLSSFEYSGTSAIRLAVSEINANQVIPGAYVTIVLKDSFNGLDPENSGAAQAIFSTVSLLQTNGGVSGVIGDVSSALSVQSALLTSRLSIPQCSYSAGSSKFFVEGACIANHFALVQ